MDRETTHDLITVLKEEFEAGRVKINSAHTLRAMERVRLLSDGMVDPSTVGPEVRAVALAVASSRMRRECRKVPLREVQAAYFEILFNNFGQMFEEMNRHGLDPQRIANHASTLDRLVAAFSEDLPAFAASIREFWQDAGPIVRVHLEEMRSLKALFGGDIAPSYLSNIASSVGLYVDTIVIPDPLHKMVVFEKIAHPKHIFRMVVKHALNLMRYRELALAEVDPPIVVIAPDYLEDDDYRAILRVTALEDSLEHYSRMFGRKFSNLDEAVAFINSFPNIEKTLEALKDPARLLIDTGWSEPLPEQVHRYLTENLKDLKIPEGAKFNAVEQIVFGKMMQVNDAVMRSAQIRGTPLIDAPTSWQYLLWKYEYDGLLADDNGGRDVMVTKALSLEGDEHGMLGGLPPESLVELRKNGAMAGLREMIRKGISDIDSATETTLSEVGRAVLENIDVALSQHDQQLKGLQAEKARFYGLDVGRYVAFGGLSIAVPMFHTFSLEFLVGLAPLVGTPSPAELQRKFRELGSKGEALKRSPAGLMFRHLKGRFGLG